MKYAKNAILGILIDPVARSVMVVPISKDRQLESAYDLIGCDLIEAGYRWPSGDVLYVDEESLINGRAEGEFAISGLGFRGRGLIVNESDPDTWSESKSPLVELIQSIHFAPKLKWIISHFREDGEPVWAQVEPPEGDIEWLRRNRK